jgi:carbon storage regulator
MLVLTRKLNEVILIDDNVEIIVLGIEHGQVKIGINAPKHVKVFRKEIYNRIKEENKEAAKSSSLDVKSIVKRFKDFSS